MINRNPMSASLPLNSRPTKQENIVLGSLPELAVLKDVLKIQFSTGSALSSP